MVYKLKPLELSFDFDDRNYALGDTVNVQVAITPNGDVDVREARVDLVCEQRYTRSGSGIVLGAGGAVSAQGGNAFTSTDYVPATSSVSERTESYVHSNVVFLKDAALGGDRLSTHSTSLSIQPNPPDRLKEARDLQRDSGSSWSFKWRLVAYVDVVRGRNPRRQRTIKVALPRDPGVDRFSAKPRLSTPKKRTGPSR